MERWAFLLLLIAAGCRGTAPDTAWPAAPGRSALLIEGDLHGFTAGDDLVHWASRLGDAEDRARADDELKTLDAATRVAVLRTGIRLRDATAARTCAALVDWQELDDWEQGHTTRLLTDATVDPAYRTQDGRSVDFSWFFERVSGAEMPYILAEVKEHAATLIDAGDLAVLHKSCSAEHLPQLARVALSTNADVRQHALDIILTVALHTDQHRDHVAAALLGLTVDDARRLHTDTADGLSPLLVRVLSLDKFPFDPNSKFRGWAWRWLKDSRPSPRDVDFLLALDGDRPNDMIAWVLRDVSDPRIDPWLIETTPVPEPPRQGNMEREGERSARLGALAHRGNRDALDRLVVSSVCDVESLCVLLAIAPERGRELVERVVFGDDADAAIEMLGDVQRAWTDVPAWAGIDWDDAVFEGFADAALARKLDGVRLATIGVSVPHGRRREVAAAAVAAMPRDRRPGVDDDNPLALDGDVAAFLETAAPEAFRALLRDWAQSSDEPTRTAALGALAHLGDPPSGVLLVEEARRGNIDLHVLARSPCPEVLNYLRENAPDDVDAAVAYGFATGLPERVELTWFLTDEEDPLPDGALDRVRALLLDGRWKDAVAHALAAAPDRGMSAFGLIDDDRVRAHLHRLQEHRELRLYPAATAELAAMGDPAARAEYEHALRTGRYRWGDETDQIAFGDGLRALPFWMDLLETNCCRLSSIRSNVFDRWFDLEFQSEGGNASSTPVAEARRFIARAGGRFVWSRLYRWSRGSYVPGPR